MMEENARLRELLKRCAPFLELVGTGDSPAHFDSVTSREILQEVRDAL